MRRRSTSLQAVGRVRLLVLSLAAALGLIVPALAIGPASANGGVDITGWCRKYYNSQAFNAVVIANNVYGWRCQYGSDYGTRLNVDMNAACAFTYPAHPGWATYSNYNNPYSWICIF